MKFENRCYKLWLREMCKYSGLLQDLHYNIVVAKYLKQLKDLSIEDRVHEL